ASTQIADKATGEPAGPLGPDISVAVIRFHSGVVARLTCSVIAQRNHRLQIFGERGTLKVEDCWYDACPVYLERETPLVRKMRRQSNLRDLLGIGRERVPAVRHPRRTHPYQSDVHALDYAQGVADLAEAIRDQRPPKLSAAFCLHCNEMALAIQDPAGMGCPYEMTTLFEPLTPGPPEAR
ncbi:MAG: Gfo/Idh/MocA family oxidoreductase, partial [Acidobacteriota bacterium]|nr:Gfo/Idh/MocA family oxidoreductase [Acidobacteriota bacterium]